MPLQQADHNQRLSNMTRYIEQTLWGRALSCNLKTWTPCSGGIKRTRPAHVAAGKHNQDKSACASTELTAVHGGVGWGNGERVCLLQSGRLQPPRRDQFVHRTGAWTDGNTTTPNDPMTVSCSVNGAQCCQGRILRLISRKTKEKSLSFSMTSLPLTSLGWLGDGQAAQLTSKTRFLRSVRISQQYTTTAFAIRM